MFSGQLEKSNKKSKDVEMNELSSLSTPVLQPTYVPSAAIPSLGEDLKEEMKDKSKKKEKEKKLSDGIIASKYKLNAPEEISLDKVIAKSTLADGDSEKQAENIRNKFNEDAIKSGKSCFSTSIGGRGTYLQKDEFMLGSRNRTPELTSFKKDYNTTMAVKIDGTEITQHGIFKHYDLFFGEHGTYVLNVPQDKIAKAMSGNQPLLFGPGPHVIKDPNFKFNERTALVNQSEPIISHGNLHIIRVPKGFIAKIWIGSEPYILDSRTEPYVFNSPLLRFEKNGDQYFFSASDLVIKHGPINIIHVPAGFIAKIWDGGMPKLLEAREEPYVYNSPSFSLVKNGNSNFFSATDSLIVHGAIKRILPPINNVAVTSDGGNLKIIKPSKDGSPTIIDSPSQKFEDYLSTSVQTLIFPSEETKAQRMKDNKDASKDHINYEVFRTKDSLKVGVKLLVAYQITDPDLAIKTLGMGGIVPHIENLANVDMGMAIQQSSSQEFLTFYQTKPHRDEATAGPGSYGQTSSPPPQHYQDIVKQKLAKDLEEVGIKLVRLNIENPIILNEKIAAQMEEQSLLAAEANAKEAVLRQKYNIETAEAERQAAIKKVAQNQVNEALLSTAQAELEAAKLKAEAQRVAAQAKADALLIEAKARQEAAALEGKMLKDNPALMEMRKLEIKMNALQNMKFFPPQAGTMPANLAANPFVMFGQFAKEEGADPVQEVKQEFAQS